MGGDRGMASRRCLSSSASLAACFLLFDPRSPDLVLRRRRPRLERRAGVGPGLLADSGIGGRLVFGGGGGVPAEGVRGLLEETILEDLFGKEL